MAKKKVRDRGASSVGEVVKFDLTPMIDVVFQMIMFFIIITDFTQKDIALLELPWSTVGEEDEGLDPERIIINITAPRPSAAELQQNPKDWPPRKLEQADQILVNNKPMTFMQLSEYLVANGRQNPRYRDPQNPNLSTRSLLIRCDANQAFDLVEGVLQVCALPTVAIYKIEIATAEESTSANATVR